MPTFERTQEEDWDLCFFRVFEAALAKATLEGAPPTLSPGEKKFLARGAFSPAEGVQESEEDTVVFPILIGEDEMNAKSLSNHSNEL